MIPMNINIRVTQKLCIYTLYVAQNITYINFYYAFYNRKNKEHGLKVRPLRAIYPLAHRKHLKKCQRTFY